MITLEINGQAVQVAPGTRVIEACKQAGVVVPHFCYHPGLSVAGNCRMCMVHIEERGRGRVDVACVAPASEGMKVTTETPAVLDARKGVMEFLLLNHPIDCPYCDCAGECKLQDYFVEWGATDEGSRRLTLPVHKPKRQPIGPTVMLDSERCVLCTRCVRFCREVTGTAELGITERGSHNTLHLEEGKTLDNPYSGNVVDICPVGALTDRDFRFNRRVWFLKKQDSICPGCSRGCNIEIHFDLKREYKRHEENKRVYRFKPRYNAQVNTWWLCDEGRYSYPRIDRDRQWTARLLEGGALVDTARDRALDHLAGELDKARKHPESLGVWLSPQMSNEALLVASLLFGEGLKAGMVEAGLPREPFGQDDALLRRGDPNPNRKGAELLKVRRGNLVDGDLLAALQADRLRTLVVFRWDLAVLYPDPAERAAFARLKNLVVIDTHERERLAGTTHVLPAAEFAEQDGSFTNFEGRVQHFGKAFEPLGEAQAEVELLLDLARRLGVKTGLGGPAGIRERLTGLLPGYAATRAPGRPAIQVSKEAAPR
jgi:NADH-quinone oxidoreductase subunit G